MIEKDDGLRFRFIENPDFKVIMHDDLEEFPDMTLPCKLARVLAKMLMEQHQLRMDKENDLSQFKSILEILQETGDKVNPEVLRALIDNYDFKGDAK